MKNNYQTINKLEMQYKNLFGEIPPLMQITSTITENHKVYIALLEKCIKSNKPVEYYIDMKDDVLY